MQCASMGICPDSLVISMFTSVSNNPKSQTYSRETVCMQNKFLVSKETVVLRRWERSKQKFGFIKRVDKG